MKTGEGEIQLGPVSCWAKWEYCAQKDALGRTPVAEWLFLIEVTDLPSNFSLPPDGQTTTLTVNGQGIPPELCWVHDYEQVDLGRTRQSTA
jgi:hypothetical protein